MSLDRKFVDTFIAEYSSKLFEVMKRLDHVTHRGQSRIDLSIHPAVFDSINSYAEGLDHKVNNNSSLIDMYKQSFWEHLTKVAINRRISRIDKRVSTFTAFELDTVMVREKDYKKALKYLTPIEKNVPYIIDSIGTTEIETPSRETIIERVYRYIQVTGTEGILRTTLYRKLGNILSPDLDSIVKTLKAQGRISIVPQIGKPGDRVKFSGKIGKNGNVLLSIEKVE